MMSQEYRQRFSAIFAPPSIRECEIKGVRRHYDACGNGSLRDAKAFYKHFTYIGSGHIIWINGRKQSPFTEKHWFFVRNN